MGEKWSASYHLVASPGAEGFVSVATVPDGKVLHVKRIEVFFPTGVSDELHVAFYYGNAKVFPDEGDLVGDNIKYDKPVELRYYSQDPIRVWYKNDNTTYERIANIVVEGELE